MVLLFFKRLAMHGDFPPGKQKVLKLLFGSCFLLSRPNQPSCSLRDLRRAEAGSAGAAYNGLLAILEPCRG